MSDSIVTLDVGGQMFKTQISTLTKYPGSMLAAMFNHQDQGMVPMAKTKDGAYFLDVDPSHFREILNYLRYGKIITKDSELLECVKNLADYFGLTELIKELGSTEDNDWIWKEKRKSECLLEL